MARDFMSLAHYRIGGRPMTDDDYDQILEYQGGCCAVCLRFTRLQVDHDHDTGEVRGLLCGLCNRGLGQLQDSLQLVLRAAQYLNPDNLYPMQHPILHETTRLARLALPA